MQTFESVLYEIGCGIYPAPEIEIDFEQYVHIEDQALRNVTNRNSLEIVKYLDKWALRIKEVQEDNRN